MSLLDLVKPTDLSQIARLQWLAREVVDGFTSGRHRSPRKGFSAEFREHRPYVPGDELKNLDWKAFAKSDRLYTREFDEDTNLQCMMLVDQSGSMQYQGERSGGRSKHEYAQIVAASLAYLLLSQQDSVGVVTFDHRPRTIVPARSRPSHLNAILTALAKPSSKRQTDVGDSVRSVAPKLRRRGLIVLLTDAMSDVESLRRALACLRSQKHEVMLFQILDPDEVDFPFTGRLQMQDLENQRPDKMLDAGLFRDRYLETFRLHQKSVRDVCHQYQVDFVEVTSDLPAADLLHQYVSSRRRRA